MSDAAAFFAKKKKKKTFKFNANLVDVSAVTATVHVDAPALSTDQDGVADTTAVAAPVDAPETVADHETRDEGATDWDDEALAAATTARPVVAGEEKILDMKNLELRGGTNDDIAEKLRVEETKAQLAAAREGMEREAAKIKEEREKKEAAAAASAPTSNRFGAAAASLASSGTGKWVPPSRQRAMGWGAAGNSTVTKKLDTQDQELFPDLAAAGKILEQKEKEAKPVFKAPKKTPVGGGASWASKIAKPAKAPAPAPKEPEASPEKPVEKAPPKASEPAGAPAAAAAPKPVKKVTKKKKKDLSTFKSGGS